jgi:hypothetical protein
VTRCCVHLCAGVVVGGGRGAESRAGAVAQLEQRLYTILQEDEGVKLANLVGTPCCPPLKRMTMMHLLSMRPG